jgi:hypothetical protein
MAAGISWPDEDEEKIPKSTRPSSLSSVRLREAHRVPATSLNLTQASPITGSGSR